MRKKMLPKKQVADTRDPVFFTVSKIQLGWIHNKPSWWLTLLYTTPATLVSTYSTKPVCTHLNQQGTHHILTPHSSNNFHLQLNSATSNFHLWSSVTWVHCAAPGGSWDKQDEFRLSPFFQSEMLSLYDCENLLTLILVSLRLSL